MTRKLLCLLVLLTALSANAASAAHTEMATTSLPAVTDNVAALEAVQAKAGFGDSGSTTSARAGDLLAVAPLPALSWLLVSGIGLLVVSQRRDR